MCWTVVNHQNYGFDQQTWWMRQENWQEKQHGYGWFIKQWTHRIRNVYLPPWVLKDSNRIAMGNLPEMEVLLGKSSVNGGFSATFDYPRLCLRSLHGRKTSGVQWGRAYQLCPDGYIVIECHRIYWLQCKHKDSSIEHDVHQIWTILSCIIFVYICMILYYIT